MDGRLVFFEPWGMGDALIAAAIAREVPNAVLACRAGWQPLVQAATALPCVAVDLPYATRARRGRFDFAAVGRLESAFAIREVLSIRGDVRDYVAARRLFPGVPLRMTGWGSFWARQFALVDWPYRRGWWPVRNRYRVWAGLAQVPFAQVEQDYRQRQQTIPGTRQIAMHVGAQWRSKQYPEIGAVARRLRAHGYAVNLIAGPADPVPPGVAGTELRRVVDQELVDALRGSDCVISNDSGPMHLAALLGCRTLALGRMANLVEWIPPVTEYVAAAAMPRGYRHDCGYMSDQLADGWPAPEVVAERALAIVRRQA